MSPDLPIADSSIRRGGPLADVREWVADLGQLMIDWTMAVGDVAIFFWRTLTWLFTRLPRRETLLPNFYQIGVLSLPVVALTGTFIGMVLAVQSYYAVPRRWAWKRGWAR